VQSALLAAVLFGASTPLAKGLLASVPPQVLAGLLYLGSGLGLGVLRLWRRRTGKAGQAALTRRDLPWLVGAIAFGGFLGPLLLLLGLSQTPVSAASLLLNLEGVFTALLAWSVFRENVDQKKTRATCPEQWTSCHTRKCRGEGAVMDAALIGSAQKVEHYEIAAYGCLITYAQLLGFSQATELLKQTLAEEEATDKKRTELGEAGINEAAATAGGEAEAD
jgi:hypothetical protein